MDIEFADKVGIITRDRSNNTVRERMQGTLKLVRTWADVEDLRAQNGAACVSV